MWTPDVLGAPSAAAEYAAMSPDLPPPHTLVLTAPPAEPRSEPAQKPAPPRVPPGWYRGASGRLQWWDGAAWGPVAPPAAAGPIKETGVAYVLFFLLGGISAHRFYLGLTGSAIVFNLIWWGGWLSSEIVVGLPLIAIGATWLFVDLFRIPSLVRSVNGSRGRFR
jgi:hypothetical protein